MQQNSTEIIIGNAY